MIDEVLITRQLTDEDIRFLSVPYSWEEGIDALKYMHLQNAPGPDGIHACSFQKYWHIIGEDVALFALKVLNQGLDLFVINHTYISHVLK